MKDKLAPRKFDKPLLPAVVAIILLGLGALAWEWHYAHHTPVKPNPTPAKVSDP